MHLDWGESCLEPCVVGVSAVRSVHHLENNWTVKISCCRVLWVAAKEDRLLCEVALHKGSGRRNLGERQTVATSLYIGIIDVGSVVPAVRKCILIVVPGNSATS